jgi:hypothetical protein
MTGRLSAAVELARLLAELLDQHPGPFAAEVAEPDGPLFARLAVIDVADGTRLMLVVEELGR